MLATDGQAVYEILRPAAQRDGGGGGAGQEQRGVYQGAETAMSLDEMTSVELHEWAEKTCGVQKLRAEIERLRADNARLRSGQGREGVIDIVERLRVASAMNGDTDIRWHAADEIERLRALLEEAASLLDARGHHFGQWFRTAMCNPAMTAPQRTAGEQTKKGPTQIRD